MERNRVVVVVVELSVMGMVYALKLYTECRNRMLKLHPFTIFNLGPLDTNDLLELKFQIVHDIAVFIHELR